VRIARFAGIEHPTTFNGRDLAAMMSRPCRVGSLGKGAFQGAVDYAVRCGERGVVITEDCGTKSCRMFPSRFLDLADEVE
jgi:hypothetical protein